MFHDSDGRVTAGGTGNQFARACGLFSGSLRCGAGQSPYGIEHGISKPL